VAAHVVRFPDLGEGIVEAELIEWLVDVGDTVTRDSVLAVVMTDKATVEVFAPVEGTVSSLGGRPGDVLVVGSDFVGIERSGAPDTPGNGPVPTGQLSRERPRPHQPDQRDKRPAVTEAPPLGAGSAELGQPNRTSAGARPLAPPSLRKQARELGIELRDIPGTGRGGRITHSDFARYLERRPARQRLVPETSVTELPVRGLRRAIAEKMSTSWSRIPHITYVEEVDLTELESLRLTLNRRSANKGPRLTLLPFILRALVAGCADYPHINATFDDENATVVESRALHVGIATQTSDGLVVPVVRHVEALDLWDLATEISLLTEAARHGSLSRNELSGSTITVSSLGVLGGIITTPIINYPEVAIVGINKKQIRPMWTDHGFVPREMMNLSSSFDHRVVDGYDAAEFIHRIKSLLETPALLFLDERR